MQEESSPLEGRDPLSLLLPLESGEKNTASVPQRTDDRAALPACTRQSGRGYWKQRASRVEVAAEEEGNWCDLKLILRCRITTSVSLTLCRMHFGLQSLMQQQGDEEACRSPPGLAAFHE